MEASHQFSVHRKFRFLKKYISFLYWNYYLEIATSSGSHYMDGNLAWKLHPIWHCVQPFLVTLIVFLSMKHKQIKCSVLSVPDHLEDGWCCFPFLDTWFTFLPLFFQCLSSLTYTCSIWTWDSPTPGETLDLRRKWRALRVKSINTEL